MKKLLLLLLITTLCFTMFSCDMKPHDPGPGTEGDGENTSPESDSDPAESGDKTIEDGVTEPESETEFVRPEAYEYIQTKIGVSSILNLVVNGEKLGGYSMADMWSARYYIENDGVITEVLDFDPVVYVPAERPSVMPEITFRPEEADEVVKVELLQGEIKKDCYYVFGEIESRQEPLTLDDLVPGNTYCRCITVYYPEPEGGVTEPGLYGNIMFCYAVNIV
ncbi:MAG: hypothetical protein IKA82_02910 [Clostridia bacterium]|nr:hypothetical protein [Clostridia bacterium]